MNAFKKYGYVWVTLILFLASLAGHLAFAWQAYLNDQEEHGQPPVVKDYVVQVSRDILENWQSEFLQLMWQVAGLAFLFYVSSPQSKEGDDRKEEKIDEILKAVDPTNAESTLRRLARKYPKK